MPVSPFEIGALRAVIVSTSPELADGHFTLLSEGWDSVAVDVDDRLIFKFPRHDRGEAALRREVQILSLVASRVSMRVPVLTLYEEPMVFSVHDKIKGSHLLTQDYEALDDGLRQRLGENLGQFYAELHAISPSSAATAGAVAVDKWLDADEILDRIRSVLPEQFRSFAETVMADWASLPADPLGPVYGFFDGHGWNMAFDHLAGTLNGVYDFADSGIGPLHQEFIYSSLISADLTGRIIDSYEQHTGRSIDRNRVELLTGVHRLWELAEEAQLPANTPALIDAIAAWARRT